LSETSHYLPQFIVESKTMRSRPLKLDFFTNKLLYHSNPDIQGWCQGFRCVQNPALKMRPIPFEIHCESLAGGHEPMTVGTRLVTITQDHLPTFQRNTVRDSGGKR